MIGTTQTVSERLFTVTVPDLAHAGEPAAVILRVTGGPSPVQGVVPIDKPLMVAIQFDAETIARVNRFGAAFDKDRYVDTSDPTRRASD